MLANEPTFLAPIQVGDLVAERYVVRSCLGAGGMGIVYQVLDRELDEEVALKMIHEDRSQSDEALGRFRREVKLARKVTHPNVARTFDFGRHGGLHFLTMELVAGTSLAARMSTPLPLGEALRIATAIAQGLAAAHAKGVVHRDLKPDNVLLAGERVVITDFGIARVQGDAKATSGAIVGTPAYMAPEQLGGTPVDGRADVYALGIVLFELVTGTLPFQGDTPFAMAAARLSTTPTDPRTLNATVPEGVARLILDTLNLKREDRPDAQALSDRLDALRGAGAPARPVTPNGLFSLESPPRIGPASVRFEGIDADAASTTLARDLSLALRDALSAERGLQLVSVGGESSISGELRVAGPRARFRVRQVDRSGAVVWSARVEGDPSDPFELEDRVVAEVTQAVRSHLGPNRGPSNPALRERWTEAMGKLAFLDPNMLTEALAALETLHREDPRDPVLMASLALALLQQWVVMAGVDAGIAARAEELALRALDADAHLADACFVMARVRMLNGDVRAGMRGLRECVSLAPTLAAAHVLLGAALCDAGQLEAGFRRFEVGNRLDPEMPFATGLEFRARMLAGHAGEAAKLLAAAKGTSKMVNLTPVLCEVCAWSAGRDLARIAAEQLRQLPPGSHWEASLPLIDAIANGERPPELLAVAQGYFEAALQAPLASWNRGLLAQIGAAHTAGFGAEPSVVLGFIEAAAAEPACIDLLWFDRVPFLAPLRADPRFAAARARVAARVADLAS